MVAVKYMPLYVISFQHLGHIMFVLNHVKLTWFDFEESRRVFYLMNGLHLFTNAPVY